MAVRQLNDGDAMVPELTSEETGGDEEPAAGAEQMSDGSCVEDCAADQSQ
jgi:hypothetical protein